MIYREEGLKALYKGFVPKVLRLAPGGGVLLLVVEVTLGLFRKGVSKIYCEWWIRGSDRRLAISTRPTLHLEEIDLQRKVSTLARFRRICSVRESAAG